MILRLAEEVEVGVEGQGVVWDVVPQLVSLYRGRNFPGTSIVTQLTSVLTHGVTMGTMWINEGLKITGGKPVIGAARGTCADVLVTKNGQAM